MGTFPYASFKKSVHIGDTTDVIMNMQRRRDYREDIIIIILKVEHELLILQAP